MDSKGLVAFIVDDEDVIASMLEMILANKGFDARSFFNPLDALKAAHSAVPDLLITDITMSKMNGIELAVQMKQLHPHCEILLSSGYFLTSEQLAEAGSQGRQFAFLPKPVRMESLFAKIDQLLGDKVASVARCG